MHAAHSPGPEQAEPDSGLAAMAVTGPRPSNWWSLTLLTGGPVQNGPESVKVAPLLGAAERTLDGEDRSEIIKLGGKGSCVGAPKWLPKSGSLLAASNTLCGARERAR